MLRRLREIVPAFPFVDLFVLPIVATFPQVVRVHFNCASQEAIGAIGLELFRVLREAVRIALC